MTELAIAVNAGDELWTLDALPTPEAPYVEVEDELIEVRSRFPSSYYTLTGETLPPRIRVRRGIAGTTKASHVQGSTLTPNYGLGSGGGGGAIAVDNTVDPPADVTTIIAPGADVSTPGTATIGAILSETEPVGVFADGALWIQPDPSTPGANNWQLRVIREGNWWLVGAADDFGEEAATGLLLREAGTTLSALLLTPSQVHLTLSDAADHVVGRFRSSAAEGIQIEKNVADSDDIAASLTMTADGSTLTGGIGFYGTAPIAKPTGVAVTAEGIHAALVSLGLIAA